MEKRGAQSGLRFREDELLPCTRWMVTYTGRAFVKEAYSVHFEDGKVARVTDSQTFD